MNKLSGLLAAVALAVSCVGAVAADLPIRSAPPPPAPYLPAQFSWTGLYIGLHGGYGWTAGDVVGIHTPGGGFDGNIGSTKPRGFLGGGQIGYNLQYGNIVYGVEGDASFTSRSARATAILPITGLDSVREKENWFGSVRARLGLAVDRSLFYITGGAGLTDINSSISTSGGLNFGSKDSARFSWVGGAGVEYAFTNNWTARLEGLYYGVRSFRLTNSVGFADYTRVTQAHGLVRVGVNYKF